MRRMSVSPLLLVGLILLAGPGWAETFTARVVSVTDGDTLKVLRNGHSEIVRLRGIDAPEKGQAYGQRAKQFLSTLAFGATVTVQSFGRDRNGRLLADITLPDGRNLNEELVQAGYAWWFRRYSTEARLARLEHEARDARRGLWADLDPIPPWDFRRRVPSSPTRS